MAPLAAGADAMVALLGRAVAGRRTAGSIAAVATEVGAASVSGADEMLNLGEPSDLCEVSSRLVGE